MISSLRHLILHNFWLKLFSLGLASLIWLAVHYQIQSDYAPQPRASRTVLRQEVVVPISIIAQPGDGRVFKITPRQATATTVGEEGVLDKMSPKSLVLFVDLSDYRGRQPTNQELHVHAPAAVSVIKIEPATVLVECISP